MELTPGAKLGPYEIVSPLGAGGMGEVWKARDTRLERTVAVKVMPQYIAGREDLRARFEREARTVSSLNHPNICVLYDIGKQDGIGFMVLEHLEGETLAGRIAKGPLPLDQALKYAGQIGDALDRAHRSGVSHRDVKPANIMLTRDGVKVLDFGLAKTAPKVIGPDDVTPTKALTGEGTILGTPQYMAPEQYEGNEADARSDIFAFGCVVYEMVTGKRCFDGKTKASLIAAVLGADPVSMRGLAPMTPPALERLVKRCLAKDPEDRYQSMRDVVLELRSIGEGGTDSPAQAASPAYSAWLAVAAGVSLVIAAALAFVHFREQPAETPIVRFDLAPPEKTTFGNDPAQLSPDGRRIVFTADSADGKSSLWVRSLDTLTARLLAGTEGGSAPFWSPDSRSIGFRAAGKLKRIDVSGGPALTLADAPNFRGGTWSRDGAILFTPDRRAPLQRIAAAGGEPSPAANPVKPGDAGLRWPWFLPDGRHFLAATPFSAAGDHVRILAGVLNSQEVRTILEADSNAVYAGGSLLYLRESTLMAQPFDPKSLVTTGPAVPVAENVRIWGTTAVGLFSVSENGMMAYATGESALKLAWFDRSGKRISTVGDPGSFMTIGLSPDGNRAVAGLNEHNRREIWIYDLLRGLRTRFASDSLSAIWSPDGATILFEATRNGKTGLYRKASDGTGAEELIYADDPTNAPASWSPDGKVVLYSFTAPKTGFDIWVLPMTPEHPGSAPKAHPWLRTEFSEYRAQFSPDGRWVVYESNESGRFEVYVAPFSGSGGKRQVSTEGGTYARWRRDGKEIFYIGPDRKLHAVEVNAKSATVETGQPHTLFGPIPSGGPGPPYDVSADGQRILIAAPPEQEAAQGITVVQNWMAGLKK